jgi:hypothetical protein
MELLPSARHAHACAARQPFAARSRCVDHAAELRAMLDPEGNVSGALPPLSELASATHGAGGTLDGCAR